MLVQGIVTNTEREPLSNIFPTEYNPCESPPVTNEKDEVICVGCVECVELNKYVIPGGIYGQRRGNHGKKSYLSDS